MLSSKRDKKHIHVPISDQAWTDLRIEAMRARMSLEKLIAEILEKHLEEGRE